MTHTLVSLPALFPAAAAAVGGPHGGVPLRALAPSLMECGLRGFAQEGCHELREYSHGMFSCFAKVGSWGGGVGWGGGLGWAWASKWGGHS